MKISKKFTKEYYIKYGIEYRKINKEKLAEKRIANKEKLSEYNKKRYQEKKEHIKESVKKYQKIRKHKDPIFKLKSNIRTSLNNLLKNRGFTKKERTFDIVGCTFEEFKIYIENQFKSWMSWENYGLYNGELNYGWDLDHIIPISSATTEEDVIRLNHYTNLQPLCGFINRCVKRKN